MPRMRNYKAMGDDKLARAYDELTNGGEALDRCVASGSGDPAADIAAVQAELTRRGIAFEQPAEVPPAPVVAHEFQAFRGADIQPHGLSQQAKAVKTVAEGVGSKEAVLEPKLDGWRLLAHVHEDGVQLYSRAAKKYGGCLPRIEAELVARFPTGTWLDGEVVAPEGWGSVQSALGSGTAKAARISDPLTYVVFDLIAHGGIDARPLPQQQRRELLEKTGLQVEAGASRVRLVEQHEATQANHDALVEAGHEGSIIKHVDARYASGARGHGWFKIKSVWTMDVILTDLEEGTNSNAGQLGVMIFSQIDPATGLLVQRGRCKVLGDKLRHAITDDPDAYLGRVMEVKHNGVMVDGIRHPQFLRWRDDKDPREVTLHDA